MEIRIAGTASESIVDGPGLRYTVFVQGCPHNCEGCHNPHTHDFSGGKLSDTDKIFGEIIDNPLLDGVTFSGGEPFCQPAPLAELGKRVKEKRMNVWCFSGFTFEELLEKSRTNEAVKSLMECIDVLIDGRFILSERSLELKFKGSRNQRTLDMAESLRLGKAVEVSS